MESVFQFIVVLPSRIFIPFFLVIAPITLSLTYYLGATSFGSTLPRVLALGSLGVLPEAISSLSLPSLVTNTRVEKYGAHDGSTRMVADVVYKLPPLHTAQLEMISRTKGLTSDPVDEQSRYVGKAKA